MLKDNPLEEYMKYMHFCSSNDFSVFLILWVSSVRETGSNQHGYICEPLGNLWASYWRQRWYRLSAHRGGLLGVVLPSKSLLACQRLLYDCFLSGWRVECVPSCTCFIKAKNPVFSNLSMLFKRGIQITGRQH